MQFCAHLNPAESGKPPDKEPSLNSPAQPHLASVGNAATFQLCLPKLGNFTLQGRKERRKSKVRRQAKLEAPETSTNGVEVVTKWFQCHFSGFYAEPFTLNVVF